MALWMSKKQAWAYAGVSKKTFESWMRDGLEYSKLPSGIVRVRKGAVDSYLQRYSVCNPSDNAQTEANEVLRRAGL